MKSNIREFTQKLFLLMDAKDGSQLQDLVDELMMDLQLRITDRTARKTAACVLAERVFEVLIRAFAADSRMMEHEDKLLFLALYRVFYTDEFREEPLPPTENAVDLLRRMQAEFGRRKQYEACVAYFQRYRALCDSLPQAVGQNMMMELRLIALPYLAEMLDRSETLQPRAHRAVVIARSVFSVDTEDVGSALLLLDSCHGELFGLVPENLRRLDEDQLETVYGILCKVADLAPATFYLPLAYSVEQEIFRAVCEETGKTTCLSGVVFQDISTQERLLWQEGKALPPKLRTLMKLHHFYSILLRGGCLPEWDEL